MRSRLTACLLLFVLAGAGVLHQVQAQTGDATVRIERKTVRRVIDQAAQNVEAYQHAPLFARLPAYVKKVNVDIGDRVKAGDVLIELSVPELEAELLQKEAAVKQAESETKMAAKALEAADANQQSAAAAVREAESGRQRVKADVARTKTQYERLSRAGQSGVIDRDSVAEAKYALEASQAGAGEVAAKVDSKRALRDESKARRERAAADVAVAASKHKVAEANRDQTAAFVAYRQIKAPFDGVITQRGVDDGHFVQPASTTTPLLTIDRVDRMRVFVHLPEAEARSIEVGAKAKVKGPTLGGRVLSGKVSRTAFALDPRTRTLRTEIDVANPDRALRPGAFVLTSIELERPNVWTLPASAVRQRDGEIWCFVVEGGKARRKALQTGLEGGGLVEIVRIGDAAPTGTEAVIANPGAALKDGDAVK